MAKKTFDTSDVAKKFISSAVVKDEAGDKEQEGRYIRTSKKSKQFSVKVTPELYETFTAINEACGISNNSAVNMVLSEYVRKNKHILSE